MSLTFKALAFVGIVSVLKTDAQVCNTTTVQAHVTSITKYYIVHYSYTHSCGFWGWGRCTAYASATKSKMVAMNIYQVEYQTACCLNYIGEPPNCVCNSSFAVSVTNGNISPSTVFNSTTVVESIATCDMSAGANISTPVHTIAASAGATSVVSSSPASYFTSTSSMLSSSPGASTSSSAFTSAGSSYVNAGTNSSSVFTSVGSSYQNNSSSVSSGIITGSVLVVGILLLLIAIVVIITVLLLKRQKRQFNITTINEYNMTDCAAYSVHMPNFSETISAAGSTVGYKMTDCDAYGTLSLQTSDGTHKEHIYETVNNKK